MKGKQEKSKNKQEEDKKDTFKEENEDLDMPRVRGHRRCIHKGRGRKCTWVRVKSHRRRLPTTRRRLYR